MSGGGNDADFQVTLRANTKDLESKLQDVITSSQEAAKALADVFNTAAGTRPTENAKSRVRPEGALDRTTEAMDRNIQKSKDVRTSWQRLVFQLGLLRFTINVTQFAWKTFTDLIRLDAVADMEGNANFVRLQLRSIGNSAEQTEKRIDALRENIRQGTFADLIGDTDVTRMFDEMSTDKITQIAELAERFADLTGKDPSKFFVALATILNNPLSEGAVKPLAELLGVSENLLKLNIQDAENVVEVFNTILSDLELTPALNAKIALKELMDEWNIFVTNILLPMSVPFLKALSELTQDLILGIRNIFMPKGELTRQAATAAAIFGAALGTAIMKGHGGKVGLLGALASFALIAGALDDLLMGKGDEGAKSKAIIQLAAMGIGALIGFFILGPLGAALGIGFGKLIAEALGEERIKKEFDEHNAAWMELFKDIKDGTIAVKNFFVNSWNSTLDFFKAIPGKLKDIAVAIKDNQIEAFILMKDIILGTFKAIEDAAIALWDKINNTISNIVDLLKGGPGNIVKGIGGALIPSFADGGTVPGPRGAPRLAMVHGGETVIPVGHSTSSGVSSAQIILDGRVLGEFIIDSMGRFMRHRAGIVPGTISFR
jgi:hypothetical protein